MCLHELRDALPAQVAARRDAGAAARLLDVDERDEARNRGHCRGEIKRSRQTEEIADRAAEDRPAEGANAIDAAETGDELPALCARRDIRDVRMPREAPERRA